MDEKRKSAYADGLFKRFLDPFFDSWGKRTNAQNHSAYSISD
jgi:hypothetical protein